METHRVKWGKHLAGSFKFATITSTCMIPKGHEPIEQLYTQSNGNCPIKFTIKSILVTLQLEVCIIKLVPYKSYEEYTQHINLIHTPLCLLVRLRSVRYVQSVRKVDVMKVLGLVGLLLAGCVVVLSHPFADNFKATEAPVCGYEVSAI